LRTDRRGASVCHDRRRDLAGIEGDSEVSRADNMLDFALEVSRRAGEILLSHFEKLEKSDISYKGKRNLVTVADKKSEEFIVSEVRRAFPDHSILAEEQTKDTDRAAWEWIIDPLDGTINYAHGHPFFCVSIALLCEGDVRLGVVHAPILSETCYAQSGEGAFLDGRKLSVSTSDRLIDSLLATGFAYVREETLSNNLANFNRLSLKARGVRRYGSAAIDLAYVAAGRLDGFWELYLAPWDVAAGSLIVAEAGGRVTDIAGGSDYIYGQNIVASNGLIHDMIRENLDPFTDDDRSESQGD
jgi:myo-inositol-1(or 4)-monophosphatase